jgi:branched-chain amino acid transport system permease protein
LVAAYFIDATVLASLYSLMCVGLTLTYMTTKVPNFAYGSMVTLGAYVSFTLTSFYKMDPYTAAPLAFLLGGVISVAIYLVVLKPMIKRNSSLVSLMIATLAVDIFFVGIFGIYSDYMTRAFRITNSKLFILSNNDFAIFGQRGILLTAPLVLVALAISLHLVLTRTKFGIAMRATVENSRLASISGVNVNVVYIISWFLAGGLGSVAGSLLVLRLTGSPDIGSKLIVIIFAGSVIGGFGSIYGAILGGALVGGSQILITIFVSQFVGPWVTSYSLGIPLIMMVAALIFAPQGLTSLKLRRKIPWR